MGKMAVSLFVYGTLMEKPLLYRLTGKYFPTAPAYLKDFRKLTSHPGYPYIVPHKGSEVEGLLIRYMDEQSLKKLDRYEDEDRLYKRRKVTVVCDGKKVICEAYVGNPKILRPRP